jgi:hypothetical protein
LRGTISLNLGIAFGNIGEWDLGPESGLSFKLRERGSFWNYGPGTFRTIEKFKQEISERV